MAYTSPLPDNVVKVLRSYLKKAKPYTPEERKKYNYHELGTFLADIVYQYSDRELATLAMDELQAAASGRKKTRKKRLAEPPPAGGGFFMPSEN